jgi:hypothetical protein
MNLVNEADILKNLLNHLLALLNFATRVRLISMNILVVGYFKVSQRNIERNIKAIFNTFHI